MSNKEVGRLFRELASLMELYGENPFKIRSYQNAYLTLRKLGDPVLEMDADQLESISGIGKAIRGKILEVGEKGTFDTLERYRDKTPEGIRELLSLKGIGAKKIKQVWEDLGITSPGELYYACNENRLLELKGFGRKTQETLKGQLEFYFRNKDSFLYATLEPYISDILEVLREVWPSANVEVTGDTRRLMPILDKLSFIGTYKGSTPELTEIENIEWKKSEASDRWKGDFEGTLPFELIWVEESGFGLSQFEYTGPESYVEQLLPETKGESITSEADVFKAAGLHRVPPEVRDHPSAPEWTREGMDGELIEVDHLKGMVHCHSTYSDGINSLEEMAEEARSRGYAYFTITDHSRAAFYANGLSIERLEQQWEEVDKLNARWDDFRILKGIESDILNDGSLDYPDAVLKQFDIIIASVHSNLRMDEDKATHRIITAVENPHTHLLGHPTGRLLLARPGYPIDHMKVIDACAANKVDIEINANPYRLDLDWTWVPYALEKGVMISINPDAHSKDGMDDVKYGVMVARKGGLLRSQCLNALGVNDFLKRLHTK